MPAAAGINAAMQPASCSVDLQLCSCHSCQLLLSGWTNSCWDQESPGPWRTAPIRGPESHGRWQCPPLQMSPLDRGVDRERPRRRAGSRPCGLPASGLSLLPILGEPAQSWSNLRDSQSVARMADPPTAPARDPQQAPAPPQLSPLSGAYLLIVVGEPFSEEHKKLILQKLQQGKRGSLCERGVLSTQSREVFRLQIGSGQGKTCRVQRGGI